MSNTEILVSDEEVREACKAYSVYDSGEQELAMHAALSKVLRDRMAAATLAPAAPSAATIGQGTAVPDEVTKLRQALVYVAHALNQALQPGQLLPRGISLPSAGGVLDGVIVALNGWHISVVEPAQVFPGKVYGWMIDQAILQAQAVRAGDPDCRLVSRVGGGSERHVMSGAQHDPKVRHQEPDADYPCLYELTGNITDINKVIVQRLALRAILQDLELLRKHAVKEITDSTLLTGISTSNGGINMGLEGGAAALLVESFVSQFKAEGGINYVELRFTSSQIMPGERFVVTVQRVNGLTPAQKLAAAEAELKTLKQAAV